MNDTSLSLNGENSYAPLLINKIGNMTEITIQNVSQKNTVGLLSNITKAVRIMLQQAL